MQKLRLADDEVQNRRAADPSPAFQSCRVMTEGTEREPVHSPWVSRPLVLPDRNYRGISPATMLSGTDVKTKSGKGTGLGVPPAATSRIVSRIN